MEKSYSINLTAYLLIPRQNKSSIGLSANFERRKYLTERVKNTEKHFVVLVEGVRATGRQESDTRYGI